MNVHETRRYQMLKRVREFGVAYAEAFAPIEAAGRLFSAVDAAIAGVDDHAAAQRAGRRGAREHTAATAAARKALLTRLHAVRRTARVLALDESGVGTGFVMPKDPPDLMLIATARSFASAAEPFESAFISLALPATFIADLRAAMDAFEAMRRTDSTAVAARIRARLGIETAAAAGFAAVRRLDAIVPNHLRDNATAIAAWRLARHVERSPRRHKRGVRGHQAAA
jgi:hypothetical protein